MIQTTTVPVYERMLDADTDWALQEGGLHFEHESAVHKTLRKLAQRLDELGISYATAGAMGMFLHGYRRFTEDVDILVTADDLLKIHQHLDGLGYIRLRSGGKNLRDAEHGVRIEFLKAGDYPGDGKPKPVAFPIPEQCAQRIDEIWCVRLPKLIELKLASGMAPGRRKDLGDVQEMIKVLGLSADFAGQLDPYVRPLYLELWTELQNAAPEP